MVFGMQDQMPVLFEPGDGELTTGFRGPIGDGVTRPDILQPGDDVIGAGTVRGKEEPVDPLRGIPAAAMPPHLDQPGPDLRWWRIDSDGVCRDGLRVAGEPVAG
jgi:hypothetical protein